MVTCDAIAVVDALGHRCYCVMMLFPVMRVVMYNKVIRCESKREGERETEREVTSPLDKCINS